MKTKPKVLVIAGTTASGKTSLAIQLARAFSGQVISADSRQVYRGLDIGTAKVTEAEMQGVPHHLIDIAEVSEVYTAEDFKTDGRTAISKLVADTKLPIIAGGSFFYTDILLGTTVMPQVAPNPALRATLEQKSTEDLFKELSSINPERAETIDPNNKRRLMRALEIIDSLGHVPKTRSESLYDVLWLGIERSKEDIRERITKRAHQWLSQEFKDEISWLLEQNLSEERLQEFGFEYTVGLAWYRKELTDDEFIEALVAKNWQYAKRQKTWLKRNHDITWITPDEYVKANDLVTHWLKD